MRYWDGDKPCYMPRIFFFDQYHNNVNYAIVYEPIQSRQTTNLLTSVSGYSSSKKSNELWKKILFF